MTPDERDTLAAQLDAMDTAERTIRKAMQPFHDAIAAIDEVRDLLLLGREIVGKCETCDHILIDGEKGHRFDDGVLCEECAPTYADIARQHEEDGVEFDDDEHKAAFEEMIAARRADGTIDDKALEEL